MIIDNASWRWIFAINVPVIVLTLVLVSAAVPSSTGEGRRHVDVLGAALCVIGLGGLVFGLIEQPRYGWGSPRILAPLLGGAILFGAFHRL